MEYLQYLGYDGASGDTATLVLNLIINGIPSILLKETVLSIVSKNGFKPYYKWNTFNTLDLYKDIDVMVN